MAPWDAVREVMRRSGAALYGTLASIKHEAFSAEREWRFISPAIQLSADSVEFRPAQSTLVPYVEFNLCDAEETALPVRKIWIGPTPHPDHTRAVVGALINRFALSELTSLQECRIPFRQI